jgi:hypothetical protein
LLDVVTRPRDTRPTARAFAARVPKEDVVMMASKRSHPWFIALGAFAVALLIPATGRSDDRAAGDPGLQVQVDPATGRYSLPAPGTLAAEPQARSVAERVVVTPGTTAAGGFKVTRPSAAAAPPAAAAVNEQE